VIELAFWGRVSTEDNQDPESSRGWQLTRARALVAPHGGRIVAEFFDVDKSRSIPPQRRPEASRLLAALADPARGFSAVVVGEPQRAFYGNQFGNTFPIFAHYGVPLWVPEVGGPIDPDNEAHDLIMSVFGGVSKGERNRIKIRVRTAMAAQAQLEGRFLGGRPPYGYKLIDAGPHPNPAKAADGKRLHRLAIDEKAAAIVRRIFDEFLAGAGLKTIAEQLTRDGIACPSASDPVRNQHRCGIAWSMSAVRVIITNPRYTGRQVWNRQRTDEVLIDVNDVALGHTARMRWNDQDQWVWSDAIVHPPIIDEETFGRAAEVQAARRLRPPVHRPHRSKHDYVLRGLLYCGVCGRKMQGHWANHAPYYRCRFPVEYALVNKLEHPRNVTLRQDTLLPPLDEWLAGKFAPRYLPATIDELISATTVTAIPAKLADAQHELELAACDRKLAQYRAALDAGADPASIAKWITETEAERARLRIQAREAAPKQGMSRDEIASIVNGLADLLAVLRDADLADKAEIYSQLGLRLTYQPDGPEPIVRTEVNVVRAGQHWSFERVRGGTHQLRTCQLSLVSWLSERCCERAGRSVDQAHHDRLRRDASSDRRDSVLPAHAPARGTARPAGVGGGANTALSGRDDRRCVHNAARRLAWRRPGWVSPVGSSGGRQCREPCSKRRSRTADDGRPGDRGLAIVLAHRRLRVADAPGSPRGGCQRLTSAG
jgi:site-specific DNA recombinase